MHCRSRSNSDSRTASRQQQPRIVAVLRSRFLRPSSSMKQATCGMQFGLERVRCTCTSRLHICFVSHPSPHLLNQLSACLRLSRRPRIPRKITLEERLSIVSDENYYFSEHFEFKRSLR